jgi:hypothetical protein
MIHDENRMPQNNENEVIEGLRRGGPWQQSIHDTTSTVIQLRRPMKSGQGSGIEQDGESLR